MGFDTVKKVQEGGLILGALGVIGFIGIIWLMIYGNLQGNLGFDRLTNVTTNESGYSINDTVYELTNGPATLGYVSLEVTQVVNSSAGAEVIAATNYVVVSSNGTIAGSSARTLNVTAVNVTYTVTFRGASERNTDNVISNTTTGFLTFFGFSDTFFTIAAIVLLIFMLLGLLALVFTIMKLQKGSRGDSGFSD